LRMANERIPFSAKLRSPVFIMVQSPSRGKGSPPPPLPPLTPPLTVRASSPLSRPRHAPDASTRDRGPSALACHRVTARPCQAAAPPVSERKRNSIGSSMKQTFAGSPGSRASGSGSIQCPFCHVPLVRIQSKQRGSKGQWFFKCPYNASPDCIISFIFYLYLMLHAYVHRFDVTGNLEKICKIFGN
jgi:hypothetical protein